MPFLNCFNPRLKCFSLHPILLAPLSLAQVPEATFIPGPITAAETDLDPDQHLLEATSVAEGGAGTGRISFEEGGGECCGGSRLTL